MHARKLVEVCLFTRTYLGASYHLKWLLGASRNSYYHHISNRKKIRAFWRGRIFIYFWSNLSIGKMLFDDFWWCAKLKIDFEREQSFADHISTTRIQLWYQRALESSARAILTIGARSSFFQSRYVFGPFWSYYARVNAVNSLSVYLNIMGCAPKDQAVFGVLAVFAVSNLVH